MTKESKRILSTLSQEQLVWLIEQMEHSLFMIGENCVEESKGHISPETAVARIRYNIFDYPRYGGETELKTYIDVKMGKISVEKYRKIMGLD